MATINVGSLGEYIREQRRSAQISLRQLADAAGVSNPYLSQIERGLRKPSAEILQQIAKGLRISAETLYVRAGILDERVGDAEVATAILGDAGLTERQKNVLLDIYESFCRENAATAVPPVDAAPLDAAPPDAAPRDDEPLDAAPLDGVPTGARPDSRPTDPARRKPRTRKTPASTTTERAKKPRTKEKS